MTSESNEEVITLAGRPNSRMQKSTRLLILLSILMGPLMLTAQRLEDVSRRLMVPSFARSPRILAFEIQPRDSGSVLHLTAQRPMDVFMGERLVWRERTMLDIRVDSLLRRRSEPVTLTLVRAEGTWVRAQLQTSSVDPLDPGLRTRSRLQEFVAMTIFPCVALGLWLAVFNLRMTGGFFQFRWMFSWTQREDPMGGIGFTATFNLVFYILLMTMLSALATVIVHIGHAETSLNIYFRHFAESFGWILMLILARMLILSMVPGVFGYRNANGQFYGFVRLIVLLVIITSMILLLGVATTMDTGNVQMLIRGIWILGGLAYYSVVLVRMIASAPSQALHLFSYLCISEIIPILLFTELFQSQANLDLL